MKFGNVAIERRVPCVMRDGITLYADIYTPAVPGPHPVLLMRQPYGRALASTVSHAHPVWYADKGYMVVIQDVRGRGESEGWFDPFVHEAEDGFDTVKWAARLPGSSGKVGMYGFSYQGLTQWAAASLRPPALAAMAPSMCPADLYHGMFYPHGAFALGDHLPWAFQLARDTARRAGDDEAVMLCSRMMRQPDNELWSLPLARKHPVMEQYFPAYYDWLAHPSYDAYWAQRNWLPELLASPIPALQIGGWYDSFLMGTLQSYEALQELPRTRECFHRLIVGPWSHIPWGRKAGGVDHGADAMGGIHMEQVRWFDYWLKGSRDIELFEEPPVRYFERGSLSWKAAERLPALSGEKPGRLLFLSGSQEPANGALGGGLLTASGEAILPAAPDVFVYDARLPMRSEGYLPADRSAQQDRFEILVYTGEPLKDSLSLFGVPSVEAWVQVLSGPTDLVAVLSVVEESGAARFLSVGRTEIVQGDGGADDGWVKAVIAMRPLAAELPAGSALRLELSGSAFPLFTRHPNGENGVRHTAGEGAMNMASVAVSSRQDRPSWIGLPLQGGGEQQMLNWQRDVIETQFI